MDWLHRGRQALEVGSGRTKGGVAQEMVHLGQGAGQDAGPRFSSGSGEDGIPGRGGQVCKTLSGSFVRRIRQGERRQLL